MSGPLLGYALARCHARHGDRPGAAAWRHLDGARTASQYLHFARATGLRDWLRTVSEEEPQERVELKLRHAWRRYVAEVAGWLPPAVRLAAAYLAFADRFEREFLNPTEARTLAESAAIGWRVLRGLPLRELARLDDRQIAEHITDPVEDADER